MSSQDSAPVMLRPEWPAPANIQARVTTRAGGCSAAPYDSLNLALHVGDEAHAVTRNRTILRECLGVPRFQWLNQVHGTDLVRVTGEFANKNPPPAADASITAQPGLALAVLTADCLPLLLCDRQGEQVAVAHAGWRGLAAGIIERVVAGFRAPPQDLLAYLGPAIGAQHFEVDAPVWEAFARNPGFAGAGDAFTPTPGKSGHWQCDLADLARRHLRSLGVKGVYGGELCAYKDNRFYSFRRDGVTGRFASLIWRT